MAEATPARELRTRLREIRLAAATVEREATNTEAADTLQVRPEPAPRLAVTKAVQALRLRQALAELAARAAPSRMKILPER